ASASNPFVGVVILQPAANTRAISISGTAVAGLQGTVLAPGAQLALSGSGTLNDSLIVGTLSMSGQVIANAATLSSPNGTVAYGPAQVRSAYGISSLPLDGTGQTIALVEAYDNPAIFQALDSFDNQFGLTASGSSLYEQYGPASAFVSVLNQDGQTTNLPATDPAGVGGSNWEAEAALDVEWVHALAPGAQIIVVEANSQALPDLMSAVATAAAQPGVSVVSMSWGFPEGLDVLAADEAAYDSTFVKPGVTFVASTGDYGVADPEYPSFSPNVLAVGGTSLTLNADNSYQGETGWGYVSDAYGEFIGSGGGISQYEAEPAYQQGVQSTSYRTTPDVAMLADPATGAWISDPYNLPSDNSFEVAGGTSLSAPTWAALIALVNQGRSGAGTGPLNSTTPNDVQTALYALPQSDYNSITSGSNGYTAGAGYNLVTGLGTPLANVLVPDLISYPWPNGSAPAGAKVAPITAAELVNNGVPTPTDTSTTNVFNVFSFESAGRTGFDHNVPRPVMPTQADAVVAPSLTRASASAATQSVVLTVSPVPSQSVAVASANPSEAVQPPREDRAVSQASARAGDSNIALVPIRTLVADTTAAAATGHTLWISTTRIGLPAEAVPTAWMDRAVLDQLLGEWRSDAGWVTSGPVLAPTTPETRGDLGAEGSDQPVENLATDSFFAALGAAMLAEQLRTDPVSKEDGERDGWARTF
ncbi:MAG TPA: hypothetical protein VFA18_07115, partial [Gemmataceae bacterium]|nr:hypothetical protein [Gemmataceae bacterium]